MNATFHFISDDGRPPRVKTFDMDLRSARMDASDLAKSTLINGGVVLSAREDVVSRRLEQIVEEINNVIYKQ